MVLSIRLLYLLKSVFCEGLMAAQFANVKLFYKNTTKTSSIYAHLRSLGFFRVLHSLRTEEAAQALGLVSRRAGDTKGTLAFLAFLGAFASGIETETVAGIMAGTATGGVIGTEEGEAKTAWTVAWAIPSATIARRKKERKKDVLNRFILVFSVGCHSYENYLNSFNGI